MKGVRKTFVSLNINDDKQTFYRYCQCKMKFRKTRVFWWMSKDNPVTDDTEKTEILNAFFVLFHTVKAGAQMTAGTHRVWERVGEALGWDELFRNAWWSHVEKSQRVP